VLNERSTGSNHFLDLKLSILFSVFREPFGASL
jgi:hypothetical protein